MYPLIMGCFFGYFFNQGLKLDGSHPVLLYGYGGFNISITPVFSVSRIVFLNHLNGVLAIPNIRGGGYEILCDLILFFIK
jgi:prolyl oligopeptidase PreP (S9A serine peptidase family)